MDLVSKPSGNIRTSDSTCTFDSMVGATSSITIRRRKNAWVRGCSDASTTICADNVGAFAADTTMMLNVEIKDLVRFCSCSGSLQNGDSAVLSVHREKPDR